MKLPIIYLVFVLDLITWASSSSIIFEKVLHFCAVNGHNQLSFQSDQANSTRLFYKMAFKHGLSVNSNSKPGGDTLIIQLGDNTNFIDKITTRKVLTTILIASEDQLSVVKKLLSKRKRNSFFYVAKSDSEEIEWLQILTINNQAQVVKNELQFDEFDRVKEIYDLQGLTIIATSLSWPPYVTLGQCNSKGFKCKTKYGLLVDLMDLWSQELNFKWDFYKDVNDDWGLKPKSGPYNESGEWTGVLGDVVKGKYQLSLNVWIWFPERDSFLDFVPIAKEKFLLSVIPKPPEVDYGLFVRPFRTETWQIIIGVAIVVITCLTGSYAISLKFENELSNRIVTFFTWTFFVLINAYYGGALTMFFASEISLPFQTLRDVIREVPDWTLVYIEGYDAVFQLPASQVSLEIFQIKQIVN